MGERAQRLARDLAVETLTGAARALADEAVLILERLENIDAQLRGRDDSWWYIRQRVPDHVEIKISGPLAEARQQQVALNVLLTSLAKLTGQQMPDTGADIADDLAARRNARLAQGK